MIDTTGKRLGASSLAARLFASASLLALIVLLIAGLLLSALNRRNVERAFDERLKVYLLTLIADLDTSLTDPKSEPGNLGDPRFNITLSGWYWQIQRIDPERDSPVILRSSRSLSTAKLPLLIDKDRETGQLNAREGLVAGPGNRLLRVNERTIDFGSDGRFIVSVAADSTELNDETREFDRALTLTFLLLGSALAASTLLQVRFGLAPLMRLRSGLTAIRRGEADRIEGTFPREVEPLAWELNQLLDANREIIERSRTHVGNLAHALKTPLTVLINEAGNHDDALSEMVRRQSAIMRDQMQYYLDRARAAARATALGHVCDVEPVVSSFTRTFEKINHERKIAYSSSIDPNLKFRGEQQDLEEMVGNLADNAGKWARSQVVISSGESSQDHAANPRFTLLIDDDGPGLSPEERSEVIRRGRKLDETKAGSGLGLSIVVDLAGLYGGHLTLDEAPLGGLRARLELPAA